MGDAGFSVEYAPLTVRVTATHSCTPFKLLWADLAGSVAPILGFARIGTASRLSATAAQILDIAHSHLSFSTLVRGSDGGGATDTRGRHSTFVVGNTEGSNKGQPTGVLKRGGASGGRAGVRGARGARAGTCRVSTFSSFGGGASLSKFGVPTCSTV